MTVYLVGAGPGDPKLLTLRAAELLASAEVVIHDRLVDERVIALVPPTCVVVDVGKRAGVGSTSQECVNELLVEYGKKFDRVVRLKGGDPYILGRGAEEALALVAAGCRYEVVPGVSSFAAAASAAGVPLTMRGRSSAFVVVTGHDAGSSPSSVDWESLVATNLTIVVLMGVENRAAIAARLIAAGRGPRTPVLAVERATLPSQRSVHTTLDELSAISLSSPATIVIGDVADLTLVSYEQRPLAGWRIAVTQAEDQAAELVARVETAGGEAIVVPTIAIVDPDDGGVALREAMVRLDAFEWLVFASKNAVESFFAALGDIRQLGAPRVAVIGAGTAAALGAHGVVADLVAEEAVSESLVAAFEPAPQGGGRILVPRAEHSRGVIESGLRALGWTVESVAAYRTIEPALSPEALERLGRAEVITFTSSSTVSGALSLFGAASLPRIVATIGPVTSNTARSRGVEVAIEAEDHTLAGLFDALVHFAESHPRGD